MTSPPQAHALTLHNEDVSLVCELTQGGFTRRLAETLKNSSKDDDASYSSVPTSGKPSVTDLKKLKNRTLSNRKHFQISDADGSPKRADASRRVSLSMGKPPLHRSESQIRVSLVRGTGFSWSFRRASRVPPPRSSLAANPWRCRPAPAAASRLMLTAPPPP